MNPLVEKLAYLGPEIVLLVGATLCLFIGLAPSAGTRKLAPWIAGRALVLSVVIPRTFSGIELAATPLAGYVKAAVATVGLLLLLVAARTPDDLRQTQDAERAARFEPGDTLRGEFFAFFLLSLTGVMLCAGASDLVWLFLALELTSLPTYVMVATSRDRAEAQESAVKYFFLGAMAAAVFLYGFALMYGATGSTNFVDIQAGVAADGGPSSLLVVGLVLALIGICFKIAAVPMHFYAADVYQGAATPVTAFLAFVPKTAGFVSLVLLLDLVVAPTGELPAVLAGLLAVIAVLTMTVGNVLGLLQTSVKRVLAYSSIAHTGYMLVGLLAITGSLDGESLLGNGIAAVMFYLVAYGLSTLAAFAVLGCLQRPVE